MPDDPNVLTDGEIVVLLSMVRAAKEWAIICLNADLEERLKRIYDKLDNMETNYG